MATSTIAIIISVCGVILNALGLLLGYLKFILNYERRISCLETQMMPFWKAVETLFPKIIYSPHTYELDKIIDEINLNTDYSDWSVEKLQHYYNLLNETFLDSKDEKQWIRFLILQRLQFLINRKECKNNNNNKNNGKVVRK